MTTIQQRRSFTLRGQKYHYFAGHYNWAWHNERTVELAIALRYLREHQGQRILEVGNVLSHYVPTSHEIVDKYEVGPRVRNVDVLDLSTNDPYDFILSISTLEHVGWDEVNREADKPIRALSHLGSLLRPGGSFLVTLPLGYNPNIDDALRTRRFDLNRVAFLKRVSWDNRWREIEAPDFGKICYGRPFPAANVVAIAFGNRRVDHRL